MDKNRFLLVLQREYYSIVGKKSFIVSTLLVPILMVAMMIIPVVLSEISKSDIKQVAVIDQSGLGLGSALEDTDEYTFMTPEGMTVRNMKDEFSEADGEIYAVVVIPQNVEKGHSVNIYSESTVKGSLNRAVEKGLSAKLTDMKIASYGIPDLDRIIAESNVDVNVKEFTWGSGDDENASSADIAMAVGFCLSMLTYFFVLMYGAMIMSSVVEDKTNRIVEVIVSSCRPVELMLGKVIGVALVGLTQIAIWSVIIGGGLFALGLFGVSSQPVDPAAADAMMASMGDESDFQEIVNAVLGVDWFQILSVFVIYFIGGYLLYSSLFAAFGSAVDQQSDASQFMTPVMMIIIMAFVIGEACMGNPDSTLAVVCSYIPFTSPNVMMVRLPYDVPFWEVLVSVLILYVTAILFVWLAARIYRTGILMYGRKPSYKDLFRWLK